MDIKLIVKQKLLNSAKNYEKIFNLGKNIFPCKLTLRMQQ